VLRQELVRQLRHLWKKIKFEIVWLLLWLLSTTIAYTVRIKADSVERLDDIVKNGKGGIIVLWHGATMLPIFYCRHRGFWAIISTSADGELQNRLVKSRGYKTIRGSSGANGVRAFLGAVKRVQEGAVIAVTPDGPKGPAKVAQLGSVLLAERAGCLVLPVGIACTPSKRLKSWDSHMVPMPFARAAIVFGEPIRVPESKSDEERQVQANRVADAIETADRAAEALLGSEGKRDVHSL
jgi:lysophospholipid acyltransferase (LPLAT)-like uncharacterized protein